MIKFKKKNLSSSSKKWLQRQHNDHYVLEAKRLGYRSRAFFKLEEIDKKYRFLKKNLNVLDLGSAPGSWSQYLLNKKINNILAIDILKMDQIAGVMFIQGNFLENDIKQKIRKKYSDGIDLILSDIAENTTGSKNTDSFKTNSICLDVLSFSKEMLAKKGKVLSKFFNGELDKEIIAFAKNNYLSHKIIKPKTSRKDSKEMYIFCQI